MATTAFDGDKIERNEGNQRVWYRTRTIYRLVTIRAKGQQGFGRVRNVSDGGMSLKTPVPIAQSDRVEIFFTNELSLRGRVAWSASKDCGIQFDVPISCRDLLADATHRCLQRAREPLTLQVNASVAIKTDQGEVKTTLRELSPLCLRLDSRPELGAGQIGTIIMPSGATGRGVVNRVDGDAATFLMCTPFATDEIGHFSRTMNNDD